MIEKQKIPDLVSFLIFDNFQCITPDNLENNFEYEFHLINRACDVRIDLIKYFDNKLPSYTISGLYKSSKYYNLIVCYYVDKKEFDNLAKLENIDYVKEAINKFKQNKK